MQLSGSVAVDINTEEVPGRVGEHAKLAMKTITAILEEHNCTYLAVS